EMTKELVKQAALVTAGESPKPNPNLPTPPPTEDVVMPQIRLESELPTDSTSADQVATLPVITRRQPTPPPGPPPMMVERTPVPRFGSQTGRQPPPVAPPPEPLLEVVAPEAEALRASLQSRATPPRVGAVDNTAIPTPVMNLGPPKQNEF